MLNEEELEDAVTYITRLTQMGLSDLFRPDLGIIALRTVFSAQDDDDAELIAFLKANS